MEAKLCHIFWWWYFLYRYVLWWWFSWQCVRWWCCNGVLTAFIDVTYWWCFEIVFYDDLLLYMILLTKIFWTKICFWRCFFRIMMFLYRCFRWFFIVCWHFLDDILLIFCKMTIFYNKDVFKVYCVKICFDDAIFDTDVIDEVFLLWYLF